MYFVRKKVAVREKIKFNMCTEKYGSTRNEKNTLVFRATYFTLFLEVEISFLVICIPEICYFNGGTRSAWNSAAGYLKVQVYGIKMKTKFYVCHGFLFYFHDDLMQDEGVVN